MVDSGHNKPKCPVVLLGQPQCIFFRDLRNNEIDVMERDAFVDQINIRYM